MSGPRASSQKRPPPILIVAAVATAVLAVSAAAILIRKAEAPALAIAFWRNAIAAIAFAGALAVQMARRHLSPNLRRAFPTRRALFFAAASGVCLALHFGLWIPSLRYTSVAISVVLVCTQPIFVALLAALLLGEKTPRLGVVAILVALIGVAAIASNDEATVGSNPQLGAALALGGAVTVAFYVLLGRTLRTSGVALLPYVTVVYGVAAGSVAVSCAVSTTPLWGFSWTTWAWLFAIAFGPQILGHTLMNWALEHVPAAVLSSTILLEPLVSAGLARLFLGERISAQTTIGGAVVLAALALLLWARARQVDSMEPPDALDG